MSSQTGQHKSIKVRIKRSGLESQFQALYQGYIQSGLSHEDALKEATAQIKPAVLNWEATNREVVHAKRMVSLRREKEREIRRQQLMDVIAAKQKENEDYLSEAKELSDLDNPATKHAAFRSKNGTDPWGDLALNTPSDKRADFRDIVEWVFNNIQTPVESLSPLDCPCRGAVTMLRAVRENPVMYSDFMKSHWARLIPTKAEIEAEARFRDDNAEVVKMMDVFERELNRKSPGVLKRQAQVDITGTVVPDRVDPDLDEDDDGRDESSSHVSVVGIDDKNPAYQDGDTEDAPDDSGGE